MIDFTAALSPIVGPHFSPVGTGILGGGFFKD
jgi:hypothetical protein